MQIAIGIGVYQWSDHQTKRIRMEYVFEGITKWITPITGALITMFGFIWNARERRKERKEDIAREETKIIESDKKKWADKVSNSITDMQQGIALMGVQNKALLDKIIAADAKIEIYHKELKGDIHKVSERVTSIESRFPHI